MPFSHPLQTPTLHRLRVRQRDLKIWFLPVLKSNLLNPKLSHAYPRQVAAIGGVNVGRYSSRYQAERVLLKTALAEMSTLDGSLRKVIKRPQGFDANLLGLTRETADLACRRLQARNVTCFMIGPS